MAIGFKLHCANDIASRLQDVQGDVALANFTRQIEHSSEIRSIVLEVVLPLHGSRRIVNTDNFYTSVQLLESLKQVGLYGRGTTRENSKYFFKGIQLNKKDKHERGFSLQAVSSTLKMVAASWVDANVVNIVSNADTSIRVPVKRQIKQNKVEFLVPKCVVEYNSGMQGVDRLDQLRARFSLADGHSFKKWHLKLAMAFIDIARCNAYVTRKMACGENERQERDSHHHFVMELASELLTGKWAEAIDDEGLVYSDPDMSAPGTQSPAPPTTPSPGIAGPGASPVCKMVFSKEKMRGRNKKTRHCKVCLFEGRGAKLLTVYCEDHKVCLCTAVWKTSPVPDYMCPNQDWTCWEKFHHFYLERGLVTANGNFKRGSQLAQARKTEIKRRKAQVE